MTEPTLPTAPPVDDAAPAPSSLYIGTSVCLVPRSHTCTLEDASPRAWCGADGKAGGAGIAGNNHVEIVEVGLALFQSDGVVRCVFIFIQYRARENAKATVKPYVRQHAHENRRSRAGGLEEIIDTPCASPLLGESTNMTYDVRIPSESESTPLSMCRLMRQWISLFASSTTIWDRK